MYLAISASSHATARVSIALLAGGFTASVFSEVNMSLPSSSLPAQAAMFSFPSCVPRATISLLVFTCSSFSDTSFPWLLDELACDDVGMALGGVEGREESGLRVGVVALTGVPVLEGSWLAIGVISVPISLIDTDLAVEGGGT